MSDPFLGEVRPFAFNFPPRSWALCNGALVPIRQNTALFSLIGTAFGGDGSSTFGLPNLNASLPVGTGSGPGLSPYSMGQVGGTNTVTLNATQLAAHNHQQVASGSSATSRSAVGNQLSLASVTVDQSSVDVLAYVSGNGNTLLNPQTLGFTGNNQPHNNLMPTLTLNYCICISGIFPYFN